MDVSLATWKTVARIDALEFSFQRIIIVISEIFSIHFRVPLGFRQDLYNFSRVTSLEYLLDALLFYSSISNDMISCFSETFAVYQVAVCISSSLRSPTKRKRTFQQLWRERDAAERSAFALRSALRVPPVLHHVTVYSSLHFHYLHPPRLPAFSC